MELWDRLLTFFRMLRGNGLRHFELNERLQTALMECATKEHRPAEEIQAELLAAVLARLNTADGLKDRWEKLSRRKQDVTAYTCLGYTNQQMAVKMNVSPGTVRWYMHEVQVKWHVHRKSELRQLLAHWDFSEWGPKAED